MATRSTEIMGTSPDPEGRGAELAELDAVLSSDAFRRAPTLARILEYLCKCQLRGETFVKEFEIATEVMGRSEDFDPQLDGSVRVNLHHLRKKLKQFYENEGAEHALWIALPVGQNLPRFVVRATTAPSASESFTEPDLTENEESDSSAVSESEITPSIQELVTPFTANASNQPAARARVSRFVFPLLLTALCAAIAGGTLSWFWFQNQAPKARRPILMDAVLRLGCGRNTTYQDAAGRTWNPDAYFTGGKPFHRNVPSIGGALDSTIYQNGREGDFSYDIPLPRASYELHLYFAETVVRGEGIRAMDIDINGKRTERLIDITSDANGFGNATEKIYTSIQPAQDGKIHLKFKTSTYGAFVNAIEIMPGNGDTMRPIRQTTLSNYYFDPQGTVWTPDAWFQGGRTSHLPDVMPNFSWQGFYQDERFGTFNYALPVLPDRTYSLTLYFQDPWFSHQSKLPPAGQRRFDVTCNGRELLRQFDIMKEAPDGEFRVAKTFTGIQPTPHGKILLTFTPDQNYATINAIVVQEEPVGAVSSVNK